MNRLAKNLVLWLLLGLVLAVFFELFQSSSPTTAPAAGTALTYSAFMDDVTKGQVHQVTIQGNNLTGTLTSGQTFSTYAPADPSLPDRLIGKNIQVTVAAPDNMPSLFGILISWGPMLLLIGVWFSFMRQLQGGRGRPGHGLRQEPRQA